MTWMNMIPPPFVRARGAHRRPPPSAWEGLPSGARGHTLGDMISVDDYLFFVDEALDGMVAIVTELGDDLANGGWTCRAATRRTPSSPTASGSWRNGAATWWPGAPSTVTVTPSSGPPARSTTWPNGPRRPGA